MPDTIIILDIIMELTTEFQVTQMCSGLSDQYYSQSAQVNTAYAFDWGPSDGSISDPIKVEIGAVECLLEYDSVNEEVKLVGTCDESHWDNFSISGTTLHYKDDSFEFTSDFVLINGTKIEITIEPTSSTTIKASA